MIEGKFVNLRLVTVDDAEFVLSLRCNDKKAKYLHKTECDVKKQKNYIENCLSKDNERYFIIVNKRQEPIGTYRIYDLKEDSFCIGSWLMVDGCSPMEMMEGDYLVRKYGFENLKYDKIHFDVRKGNKKVIRYHKMMGARQVGETELDYLFECTKEDYLKRIKRFMV